MKGVVSKLLYTIVMILLTAGLHAQSLDQAKKLYNEGKYAEAKPAFERLVQRVPSNSSYNHWYGVCCFETGDLETAEKHLLIAVKRKVQESYRYMGELYFLTYRFDESVQMFDEYISLLKKKKQDTDIFEKKIDLAKKGQRMLERVENIQIIDSIVVDKNAVLNTYQLSEEAGSIHDYNQFFQQNDTVISTVYKNQKEQNIYYGKTKEIGFYNLYTQSKLIDKWGDEKRLPENINRSGSNTNFPFVMPDGATIYFASDNKESLGGYDIFVTRYNTNSDTYLTPEQMGMPYNSIYNDYLLVIDDNKDLGWFVSDRFQPEDKVCVYLFIPDDTRARIEGDSLEEKRTRAIITSIRDTWKQPDYKNLVQLAYQKSSGNQTPQKEFEFVINDNTIYYRLAEIKSDEARNTYEKALSIKKQIQEVKNRLKQARTTYSKAEKSSRNQIAAAILKDEQLLENLLSQPFTLEKVARNTEIQYLKSHP
ncbi:MAG: tetratricopeptide repeat protein [Massilibacteroides sp.]|nr:tetratricopeptide repeat protein [Massilibacteroides sp.]MDD3061558.1 tetratricopeptide repeat protein [Massilibacteroides sp.]MDD4114556.1 tetratricopeptide repeat protein [Massilibacteroides sp.]MDD4659152.1 tetratricopeptide repeat protein [Massilibacteroides sp.]